MKAALFDLDDTIIDFSSNVTTAWRDACALAAELNRAVDEEALFDAVDETRRWFWSDPERHAAHRLDLYGASTEIVRMSLRSLEVNAPAGLARSVAHRYRDLRAANHSLIPGAVETLERLRAQGVLLALVTNGAGAAQRAKIERFDLARHFDHIQIEGEFGLGKPHPRVYEVALRALEVAAEHAWFIGDNLEWDVAGPQQHGIYGVWVNPGGGPPSDPSVVPDRVVRTIAEL